MTVLGLDPGLAHTGFGVIQTVGSRFMHLTHGTIKTTKDLSQGDRLSIIYEAVCKIAEKYKPDFAGIETLYFSKNVSSAFFVAQALGVINLALAHKKIPVNEVTPNTVKKTLTGIGTADKIQVQQCVKIILGLNKIPRPSHAADALAVAVTAINTNVPEIYNLLRS